MSKIRIYELARELSTDNRRLEKFVRSLGIEIKSYMSTVSESDAERVKQAFRSQEGGAPAAATQQEAPAKKKNPKVIRRRAAGPKPSEKDRMEQASERPAASSAPIRREGGAIRRAPSADTPIRRARVNNPAAAAGGAVQRRAPINPPAASPTNASSGAPGSPAENPAPRAESAPHATVPTANSAKPAAPAEASGAVATHSEQGKAPPSPRGADQFQVGQRITLPKGTHRFRGGLADRMERGAPRSESPAPAPQGGPRAPQRNAPPPGEGPAVRRPAQTPVESKGVEPVADRNPASAAPSSPTPREPAEAPTEKPAAAPGPAASAAPAPAPTPTPAASPAAPTQGEDDRRVLRDSDGVIVGAASKQSSPKILGFIDIQPRRRQQQVIITEANQPQKSGRASARKRREEKVQQQSRRRPPASRHRRGEKRTRHVSTQEMSEAKKRLRIDEAISVGDMAHQMGVKASRVMRTLWTMGMRGMTINHSIDVETAEMVAAEFGYSVDNVSFEEDEWITSEDSAEGPSELRAPVVTVMGHVDHGKTTLLDHIRNANVVSGEAGGITQHVGAYRVQSEAGPIVFLDTPGHEAFSLMRSRGAALTDILVLVVAADDGVMPTTKEAIKHAQKEEIPIVVAINKIDKPEANPSRVKQMLMSEQVVGEEFGGDVPILELSAKTGQGVQKLLETLALQAEILDLRAPTEGAAFGTVIEARVEKGRGAVATVLIEGGVLNKGDIVVTGECSGKVRTLLDDRGKNLKEATASTPVEVFGLDGAPIGGEKFHAVENEKAAKQLVAHRRELRRRKESVQSGPSALDILRRKRELCLKVVLRADVAGSLEAVKQSLLELATEKVKVEVISDGVGVISESDVKIASAGEALILGFNTKIGGKASQAADAAEVEVLTFNVIYEAMDRIQEKMVDLLPPEYREKDQGQAEVRQLFPIPRLGTVAGCRVIRGFVQRSSHVRVRRGDKIVHSGKVHSLRVFKDDVKEVKEGFECGIVVENYPELEPGDILESFELETIRPTL